MENFIDIVAQEKLNYIIVVVVYMWASKYLVWSYY